jgi:hypothetical protein
MCALARPLRDAPGRHLRVKRDTPRDLGCQWTNEKSEPEAV